MKFKTIYADPPYPIKWQGSNSIGTKPLDYPTMSIAEICLLPIKEISDDCSNLYLWVTNQFLEEGLGIVKHWGFQYRMLWTWCKNNGIGGHPRNATEHIIIASRGATESIGRHEKATLNWEKVFDECLTDLNWVEHPTLRHSKKPDIFRTMIEKFSPENRIELFARQSYQNWTCLGNEIDGKDIKVALNDVCFS